ncbi:MAG TPA: GtrA family protein [Acidimicrobiia bacterium]|nr:GtrA family protein [Acidimicrobiia bacterium]
MTEVPNREIASGVESTRGVAVGGRGAWLAGIRTGHRLSLRTRVVRYSAGSVVALGVSELTLTLLVGVARLAAGPAAVVAFLAGAVPNWILNRRWAWEHTGRVAVRRELIPYVAIVLATLAATAGASAAVDAATRNASHWVSVVAVDGAYIAATGLMFVVKFVLFDRLVFTQDRTKPAPVVIDADGR